MKSKKNPKYDLEKKRSIFFQIGLLISLSLVFYAFEYKVTASKTTELAMDVLDEVDEIVIVTRPEQKQEEIKHEIPKLIELTILLDSDDQLDDDYELIDVEVEETDVVKIKDEEEIIDDEEIPFVFVENMPIFNPEKNKTYEEGSRDLFNYMQKNAKYPIIALDNGIQGKVFVKFVVTKTGKVDKIQIIRGVDPSLDNEAIRIIRELPHFKPGNQRGRNVNVWFNSYINFVLQ